MQPAHHQGRKDNAEGRAVASVNIVPSRGGDERSAEWRTGEAIDHAEGRHEPVVQSKLVLRWIGAPENAAVQPPPRRGGKIERAAFDQNEVRPCRRFREAAARVSAVMADRSIKRAVELRERRYLKDDRAFLVEHAAQCRKRADIVFDMFE